MNRRHFASMVATVGFAAGLAVGLPVAAQEITLRVADSFPTTHINAVNTRSWIALVEERTNGRVRMEYYPAEQLGKAADLLDAALNGIADIVYAPPLYISDRLPLSTVPALPLIGNVTDNRELDRAWHTLVMEEINPVELLPLGVRAVRTQVTPPYQIMLRREQVRTLDELKGKKMRSSGGVQEKSVAKLGAIPTAIPASDLYPAIQRGTVDGILFNLPTASGYKLQEQLMWSTDNLNLGLYPVLYVINEDVWQGLPVDVQEILVQAAIDVMPEVYELNEKRMARFKSDLEAKGGGFYQVAVDEKARWAEQLRPVTDDWVNDMRDRGLPGQRIADRWAELLTR